MASAAEYGLTLAIIGVGLVAAAASIQEAVRKAEAEQAQPKIVRLAPELAPDPIYSQSEKLRALAAKNPAARRTLRKVPLNYNRPANLDFGQSSEIALSLASADLRQSRTDLARYVGPVRSTEVWTGSHVAARLRGPQDQVEIHLQGDEWRDLTPYANSKWVWDVRPLRPGPITLTLTLATQVREQGSKTVEFEVYRDRIEAVASPLDLAAYYGSRYAILATLMGVTGVGLLAGVLGWLWRVAQPLLARQRRRS